MIEFLLKKVLIAELVCSPDECVGADWRTNGWWKDR